MCNSTVFQQDGAPPHIKHNVMEYLERVFTSNRVISRYFDFTWPPRSPDLNPLDFWFWGYVKSRVYSDEAFRTIPQLKEKITRVIDEINMEMLKNVIESIPKRLQAVIASEGGRS